MNIAIIGSKDFDSLEYHIHDSLTFLGHEVFHIDISDVIKIPYRYNYYATKLFKKYDDYIFDFSCIEGLLFPNRRGLPDIFYHRSAKELN